MKSIPFSFIRSLSNNIAKSICEDIASVQPISYESVKPFFDIVLREKEHIRKFGELSHCFAHGFLVFDGVKLIPVQKFINLFGKDKILFGCFKRHYKNLRPII